MPRGEAGPLLAPAGHGLLGFARSSAGRRFPPSRSALGAGILSDGLTGGGEQLSLVDSSRSTALCPFTRQAFITPRDNYFLQLSDKGTRAESLTESPQARSLCQWISSCTYQCAVATCPCFLVR